MHVNPVILIAEDEMPTRRGIMNLLTNWSQGRHTFNSAENGLQALEFARNERVDLLITDIRMPGLDGIELLKAMKEAGRETTSILLTGYAEFEYARSAMALGAVNYILKPVEPEELIEAIEQALALNFARHKPVSASKDQQLIVKNESIRQALQFINQAISEPSLGIKEVADYVHLSPSYFSVLFKDEMQITFSDYIVSQRLKLAKELLLTTNRKVYEIAEEVGFSSSKYFVKAFRLVEGITPKQYRKHEDDADMMEEDKL